MAERSRFALVLHAAVVVLFPGLFSGSVTASEGEALATKPLPFIVLHGEVSFCRAFVFRLSDLQVFCYRS
jgi:hypothetical protein